MALILAGCAGQNPLSGEPAGVTVEEFHKMNDAKAFALMACQIDKYKDQVGTKKAREYFRENEAQAMKQDVEDIRPLPVDMIKEKGISCTRDEMARYE